MSEYITIGDCAAIFQGRNLDKYKERFSKSDGLKSFVDRHSRKVRKRK